MYLERRVGGGLRVYWEGRVGEGIRVYWEGIVGTRNNGVLGRDSWKEE